ncbi:MAG: ribonuclease J, partial [Candidatus Binatia bacterium]
LETPGIDLIIPDLSYLLGLGDRLLGVLLTHGHEAHIGALPFLLRERETEIHGTEFTIGLVSAKLAEHRLLDRGKLVTFAPGDRFDLGPFGVEALRMTHSIPDAAGFAIHTPAGTVVHTGDFKIDHTPIDGEVSDLARLAELGSEGVLLLFSDSTNVGQPGTTPSERAVGKGLERVFRQAPGKVLATTFASHIHRLQQFVDVSARFGRKVALLGRSLVQNVELASGLRKIDVPDDLLVDVEEAAELPPERVTVIAGGSQGEPRSALSRIANDDHPHVKADPGDVVVISARVIPGNERAIGAVVNHLFRRGADVHWERSAEVHTSGHASEDELKLMLR